MEVLYFAWLRERTGISQETVQPPDGTDTVEKLITWLKGRSAGHAEAFSDLDVVRVAVNEEYAKLDSPVSASDEIAFFPPVTGG